MSTVRELIEFLQKQQQDMQVAIQIYSDQQILNFDEITREEFCQPREDGWVQSKRSDMPSQWYLLFPGN